MFRLWTVPVEWKESSGAVPEASEWKISTWTVLIKILNGSGRIPESSVDTPEVSGVTTNPEPFWSNSWTVPD